MITLCHAKCWIVQLSEQDSGLTLPQIQWGFHGNIIIYPQQPQRVATILPPSVEEITNPICIIFVGSSSPSYKWLHKKAKPLAVHGHKHLTLSMQKLITYDVLNSLLANDLLPFHVEHVPSNVDGYPLTSWYDIGSSTSNLHQKQVPPDTEVAFQKLIISDVDGHASSNELRTAALRHVQKKKVVISNDVNPENEFINLQLFPKIYLTLFPFGIGGLEDCSHREPVSLK
ncbi:hypothetical protein L208DRAFT_1249512 [Tricholoma matsutake]|nr:hypothetical protein L208DRAFT_1249512 [Tricholoma matsutake 945]